MRRPPGLVMSFHSLFLFYITTLYLFISTDYTTIYILLYFIECLVRKFNHSHISTNVLSISLGFSNVG